MKASALWQIPELEKAQHRIIWWMVDAGAVGRLLAFGWQKQCASDLGIHRITINRNEEVLYRLGVLYRGKKKGEVGLRPGVFDGAVNKNFLKFKDE